MINLANVINSPTLGAFNFQVERTVGTMVNEGEYQTTSTLVNYYGQIHPPSDADMKTLPEGRRTDEVIKVLTEIPLILGDGVEIESDVVKYDGRRWRLFGGKNWKRYGYYRAFAELIHEGPQES